MSRLPHPRWLVAALLVSVGCALPASAAVVSTTQTCTSAVPWTVKATWGDRYVDAKGVSRIAVQVTWTAAAGKTLTQWEVRSFNSDATRAGTLSGQDTVDYANGSHYRQVDAVDPTGASPSVRVRAGVALDGRADCLMTSPAPRSTNPTPTPTSSTSPTPTPSVSPSPKPTPTPTATAPPRPTPTPTASPSPTSTVLFQDDFTGTAGATFDHSKWQDWSACTYNPSAAFGSIRCGDNETLDGQGHLQVPATPTTGSALSTLGTFGFTYGEMSAWIKNPAMDGYWPAFWTVNTAAGNDASKPIGEIDVMEGYTTWDNLYHRGVHNWNGDQTWGNQDDPTTCSNGADLTTSFHKYTVRVEPGKISFFVDDRLCGLTVTKDQGGGKPYAFGPDRTVPNFIILDLAVGGAGGQQNPASQPAAMLVDRVEVRSL